MVQRPPFFHVSPMLWMYSYVTPKVWLWIKRKLANVWIAFPYGWLLLFFCVPFLIIVKISFAEMMWGLPPYGSIANLGKNLVLEIRLTFANYACVLHDSIYLRAYAHSLCMAFLVTISCLTLAYPMVYGILSTKEKWRTPLLLMIILPFWISFLIRIYAWIGLLSPKGLLNAFLLYLGVIQEPILLMDRPSAVVMGMLYAYLPFMILPLYGSLSKIDSSLLEAAYDLGARPMVAFWRVLFPLSLPGAFSGAMLVFIPAVGEFVIPELLGGPQLLMIGRLLWSEFFQNRDWPLTAALATLMLMGLLAPMVFLQRIQRRLSEEK